MVACGSRSPDSGQAVATRFQGAVAADEPRAALIARDILNQGGSAADAAVALGLALTATLPSRASLGAGGACVARGGREANSSALSIGPINRPAAIPVDGIAFMPSPSPDGQIGMPGLVRGLAAVHARYGRLRWEQLVAPAETLARFGVPVSRALMLDAAAAGVAFTQPDGSPLGEGGTLALPELSVSLAAVRQGGPNALYAGALGDAYAAGLGPSFDREALRRYAGTLATPQKTELDNDAVWTSPSSGGAAAAAMLKLANGDRRASRSDPAQRTAALADAAGRALPGAPTGDAGTTGFVTVDQRGGAVACSITLGRPFGLRRRVGTTGIIPAAPVPPDSEAALSVSAALVTNENVVQLIAAAAAGGDASAPAAVAEIFVHTILAEQPLAQAQTLYHARASRQGPVAPPTAGAVAPTIAPASVSARIGAVICSGGLPNSADTCTAQGDPRGGGLGALADKAR